MTLTCLLTHHLDSHIPHLADYKVGLASIPVDPSKVVAIVESTTRDKVPPNTPSDASSQQIGANLIDFFEHEVKMEDFPKTYCLCNLVLETLPMLLLKA